MLSTGLYVGCIVKEASFLTLSIDLFILVKTAVPSQIKDEDPLISHCSSPSVAIMKSFIVVLNDYQ